jgi:hypothetical protein
MKLAISPLLIVALFFGVEPCGASSTEQVGDATNREGRARLKLSTTHRNPFVATPAKNVAAAAPPPPPVPQAVVFTPTEVAPPYRFLMRYQATDRSVVYLERGADIILAEPGKRLDPTFLTDRIEDTRVVLRNTETNAEVQISIPNDGR